MSLTFRIILIAVSVWTFIYMGRRIAKSQVLISDAVYWILFSMLLVILSIFPQIVEWLKNLIGIQSSVNCIFLIIIFLLLMKIFSLTIRVSQLDVKIKDMAQRYAVDKKIEEDEQKEKTREKQ